jgi:hypothetical protein
MEYFILIIFQYKYLKKHHADQIHCIHTAPYIFSSFLALDFVPSASPACTRLLLLCSLVLKRSNHSIRLAHIQTANHFPRRRERFKTRQQSRSRSRAIQMRPASVGGNKNQGLCIKRAHCHENISSLVQ